MTIASNTPDIIVTWTPRSTLYMFCPQTERALDWLAKHTEKDAFWYGGNLAVEQGYVMDLVEACRMAGLKVRAQSHEV